jgi:hypothetical protein
MGKKIIRKITEIQRVDIFGIYTPVHRCEHLFEGFGKQVLGIFVFKHAESRHAGTDNSDPPAEFSALFHGFLSCNFMLAEGSMSWKINLSNHCGSGFQPRRDFKR